MSNIKGFAKQNGWLVGQTQMITQIPVIHAVQFLGDMAMVLSRSTQDCKHYF